MIIYGSCDLVQGGFFVPQAVVVFEGEVRIPDLYLLILNSKEWEMTGIVRKTIRNTVNEQ